MCYQVCRSKHVSHAHNTILRAIKYSKEWYNYEILKNKNQLVLTTRDLLLESAVSTDYNKQRQCEIKFQISCKLCCNLQLQVMNDITI